MAKTTNRMGNEKRKLAYGGKMDYDDRHLGWKKNRGKQDSPQQQAFQLPQGQGQRQRKTQSFTPADFPFWEVQVAQALDDLDVALQSVIEQANKLLDAGAQNLVIINAPAYNLSPLVQLQEQTILANAICAADILLAEQWEALSTLLVEFFNNGLQDFVDSIEQSANLTVPKVDLVDSFSTVETEVSNEDMFYSNTMDACWLFVSSLQSNETAPIPINPACEDPLGPNSFLWNDECKYHQGNYLPSTTLLMRLLSDLTHMPSVITVHLTTNASERVAQSFFEAVVANQC